MTTSSEDREGPATSGGRARHVPVLLQEVLAALEPRDGEIYIDGTFGAGGYTRALLEAAACRVIGAGPRPDGDCGRRGVGGRVRAAPAACREHVRRHGWMRPTARASGPSTAWCSTSASRRCSSTRPSAGSRSRATGRSTCGWGQAGRRRRILSTGCRGGARRRHLSSSARSALAADRAGDRAAAAARDAVRHDAAAGGPDRAACSAAEARMAARRRRGVPGAAHRGQRRAGRAGARARCRRGAR